MDFIEKVNVIHNNCHFTAMKILQVKLNKAVPENWLTAFYFGHFSLRGGMPLLLSNVKNTHKDIGSLLFLMDRVEYYQSKVNAYCFVSVLWDT